MAEGSKLAVAVIGAGRAGLIHAHNFAAGRVAGASLATVVEPVESVRWRACQELCLARAEGDYRDVLRDATIAAVIVATPSATHCEIVVAAAAAGKHILCEKPMALTVADCDRMLAAVDQAGVKLQIGFMRRFDPDFLEAKELLDRGKIGRAVLIKSLTHGPSTPQPWMYDLEKSNGPLSEVNSHDIDTLRWFSGSEFEEVFAIGGNFRSPQARQQFPDFYDNVILSARLANGMQGFIAGAQGVQYGYDARCEILGERGLITAGRLTGDSVVRHTASGSRRAVVRSWMDLFSAAYCEEDQDFVRCIQEDRRPRAEGRDGRAAVLVVNAGNRSIRERRPVNLSEGVD